MTNLARVPQSVLASIVVEPEEDEEDMREVAQEYADELEEALRDVIENGALIFGPQKPRARLAYYMSATQAEDLKWIMQPDYMKGLRLGAFPPPASPFWNALAMLPDFCWQHFASDFRKLLRDNPAAYWQVVGMMEQELGQLRPY